MSTKQIQTVFRLPTWHEGQKRVNAERKRYSFICAHRGWWKTSFCIRTAFEWLLSGKDMGWWSPTHKHIQNAWIDFRRVVGHDEFFNKAENTFTVQYNGQKLGTCYFFSMVEPENARGFTLPGVGDEVGLWNDRIWDQVVKPVVDKYGKDSWFLANGTPNTSQPYNDFFHLVKDAHKYPDKYASWIIPVYGINRINGELIPDIDKYREYYNPESPFDSFKSCVEAYEMSTRKNSWAVEYLCEFITDEGGQFTGINETCCIPESNLVEIERERWFLKGYDTPEGRSGKWIQMGVDVALAPNYTVITAIDKTTNNQVYLHRFHPQGSQRWELVEEAILQAWEYFPGAIVNLDATGAGSRLADTLPRMGVALNRWGQGSNGMAFGTNKEKLLDELSSLISKHQISLFRLPIVMQELQQMVRVARASGVFDIRAPKTDGARGNDDIVSALALACVGIRPVVKVATIAESKHFMPSQSWWMKEVW